VRFVSFPPPRKIIHLPDEVVILSERDVTYRQIFTDGRPLPQDPDPSWNGFSSAKWEGDTLIAHTIGLRDGAWLGRKGSPLTDSARIIEKFRRVYYGRLAIELTVDDPKAYTHPWTRPTFPAQALTALVSTNPAETDFTEQRVFDAAVSCVLTNWGNGEQRRDAIDPAIARLPTGMRWSGSPWRAQAQKSPLNR
jgi:hypothetical protein